MLAPICPHMCEELWQALGNQAGIARAVWPEFDPAMLVSDTAVYVIQVNGKVRSRVEVPVETAEAELRSAVLSDEKVKPWVTGKTIKNFIVVPRKLVNIVAL